MASWIVKKPQNGLFFNTILSLLPELRPLRETVQAVTTEYEERKQVYDRTAAALDSTTAKLDQVTKFIQLLPYF